MQLTHHSTVGQGSYQQSNYLADIGLLGFSRQSSFCSFADSAPARNGDLSDAEFSQFGLAHCKFDVRPRELDNDIPLRRARAHGYVQVPAVQRTGGALRGVQTVMSALENLGPRASLGIVTADGFKFLDHPSQNEVIAKRHHCQGDEIYDDDVAGFVVGHKVGKLSQFRPKGVADAHHHNQ